MYKCGECHEKYDDIKEYRVHIVVEHEKEVCSYCDKYYSTIKEVETHIKNVHTCEKCNKILNTEEEMTEHKIRDHIEKEKEYIKCKICNYKTKKMFNYKRHMENKHKEDNILYIKKYECECILCDFRSNYKSSVIRHMEKVHNMIETYNCPYKNEKLEPDQITGKEHKRYNCKFSTRLEKELEEHIDKVHNKLKDYKNRLKYKIK